jgi:hypothetical protein
LSINFLIKPGLPIQGSVIAGPIVILEPTSLILSSETQKLWNIVEVELSVKSQLLRCYNASKEHNCQCKKLMLPCK